MEEQGQGKEMTPALLALHPEGRFVVVAVGVELRIFDLLENAPVVVSNCTTQSCHSDAIKCVAFDREGKLFVSAGDDKLVKLWNTNSWHCIKTVHANKKVSAATFSRDSQWLLFADKFGIVYTVATSSSEASADILGDQPVQLLAHCCSIITGLECSPNGSYLVSSDRDFKIRVSLFPQNPILGAHEIQNFCLGHTSFVSCVAFLGEHLPSQVLVSGGGDGTVRLWEYETGKLLDTYFTGNRVGLGDQMDEGEADRLAVTGISASNDASLIAVTLERLDGVLFLSCDFQILKLIFLQKVTLPECFTPTSLGFDKKGCLWLVAGAAEKVGAIEQIGADAEAMAHANANAATARVKVLSTVKLNTPETKVDICFIDDSSIPGGELLLKTLVGDQLDLAKTIAAADAANTALKKHLLKQQYTQEHRDHRKKMRNDKKLHKNEIYSANSSC